MAALVSVAARVSSASGSALAETLIPLLLGPQLPLLGATEVSSKAHLALTVALTVTLTLSLTLEPRKPQLPMAYPSRTPDRNRLQLPNHTHNPNPNRNPTPNPTLTLMVTL